MQMLAPSTAPSLLALCAAACGPEAQEDAASLATAAQPVTDAARPAAVDPEDVQEVALRYLIAQKGLAQADAHCLSQRDAEGLDVDPSKAFMDRFTALSPRVVPLSHCTISVEGDTYTPTGGMAQWFSVGAPELGPRSATVPASFHMNGRLYEGFVCQLRLQRAWTVVRCDLAYAG